MPKNSDSVRMVSQGLNQFCTYKKNFLYSELTAVALYNTRTLAMINVSLYTQAKSRFFERKNIFWDRIKFFFDSL